jgi:hypothetical protein
MTNHRCWSRLPAVLVVGVLVAATAAACGGDDDGGSDTSGDGDGGGGCPHGDAVQMALPY